MHLAPGVSPTHVWQSRESPASCHRSRSLRRPRMIILPNRECFSAVGLETNVPLAIPFLARSVDNPSLIPPFRRVRRCIPFVAFP